MAAVIDRHRQPERIRQPLLERRGIGILGGALARFDGLAGRVRALYGPEGEQATLALYRRLPPGRELLDSAAELNDALGALAGRTIERLSVTAVGPGEYGVTISTDDYELVLRLGRAGARLATIGA